MESDSVKCLTWNILAWRRDLTPLWREIERHDPDVVALQEVEWWSYQSLLADDRFVANFPWGSWVREERKDVPGWLHMRSKRPFGRCDVHVFESSRTGRGFLEIEFDDGLVVATSHLESHPLATELRLAQLREVDEQLSRHERAVFLGDMNFDGGPEEELLPQRGWVDAAAALGRRDVTWDATENELAKAHGFGDSAMRIDRAYLKGVEARDLGVHDDGLSDHALLWVEI